MQCNFGTGAGKRGTVLTQALKGRKLLLVGFTLFSMFFGAGNLIFPPDLGAKAGTNFWPAFLGLTISAVGLPVAGVIAVARADGLDKLAGRVHPVFAQVFMILIYLSIGPCLAIPRTASTSFAMLTPLAGQAALPLPAGSDFDPVRRLFATPAGGAVRCAHRCV